MIDTPNPNNLDDSDTSEGESSSGSGSNGAQISSSLFLPMPFEVDPPSSDESLVPSFWSDGSYGRIDWLCSHVQWGKWVYDARTRTLRHTITHRSFSLSKLDDPSRLLKAMTSLMIQPNGDTEHFYQLASGILKYRHNSDWNSFWLNGESTLSLLPTKTVSPSTPKHGNHA